MTVNYVLSFCKITAASKVFSRNFYLPLLKPVTPKDAVRTFRITGKWLLGAKIQHYMPVLLKHDKKRSQTSSDYGKVSHDNGRDYKYMCPELDPDNENHQLLLSILSTKSGEGMFVYTVEDKKCNLVITAPLELAIRDGDVVDVLISQRNDKIIIKLSDLKKIPLEINTYSGSKNMRKGEGATTQEEEKNHHHGKFTMGIAKIFEDKERESEEWERELLRIIQTRKKQAGEGTIEFEEMVRENVNKLDWRNFEKEAKKIIEQISDPILERHIEMEVEDLELTKNVDQALVNYGLGQLPTIREITDVVKNMPSAIPHQIDADDPLSNAEGPKPKARRRVSGVKVTLSSGKECFITGQMVHTDDGEVFVPGQTIENEFGSEYAPGITINMDNKPTLISGLIMGEDEREPMFLPTDSTITSAGQLTFSTEVEERPKPPPPNKEKWKFKTSFVEQPEPESADVQPEVNECTAEEAKPKKRRKKTAKKTHKKQQPEIQPEEVLKVMGNVEETEVSKQKEEIDYEQEKRAEMERLKQILLDDGMDELIASVEMKKLKLKQKLEEMRKLCLNMENDSINYVSMEDAVVIAENIVENRDTINKIADILLTITRRAASFRDKYSINVENINNSYTIYTNSFITDADEKFEVASDKLKVLLKTVIVAANDVYKTRPRDQLLALHTLGEVVSDTLTQNTEVIEELCQLMNTTLERNEVCTAIFRQLTQSVKENKADALKAAIKANADGTNCTEVLEKLGLVLQEGDDSTFSDAFTKLAKTSQELLLAVVSKVSSHIDDVVTEDSAGQLVYRVTHEAVKEFAQQSVLTLLKQNEEVKELLAEAAAFSRSLGLQDVAENLLQLEVDALATDAPTIEFLKRFAIIRQLTSRDYYLKAALERLRKNPECGETDVRIRQLVRLSGVLLAEPTPIRNSRDVPVRLMRSQNLLAIEDFLLQKSHVSYPVLLSRQGMQAVIPREAARSVMSGRIPYVLIDESGITNIKPVEMLINNGKFGAKREMRKEDFGGKEKRSERSLTPKVQGQVRKKYKKLLSNRRRAA